MLDFGQVGVLTLDQKNKTTRLLVLISEWRASIVVENSEEMIESCQSTNAKTVSATEILYTHIVNVMGMEFNQDNKYIVCMFISTCFDTYGAKIYGDQDQDRDQDLAQARTQATAQTHARVHVQAQQQDHDQDQCLAQCQSSSLSTNLRSSSG